MKQQLTASLHDFAVSLGYTLIPNGHGVSQIAVAAAPAMPMLPMECSISPENDAVMFFMHRMVQVSICLGADLELLNTRGVLVPVLPCWWADVGAECSISMSE
jgi:hypothetical protein